MSSKRTTSPVEEYEIPAWDQEKVVVGTDEVGRGALAGPVVAAAVVLPPRTRIEGLRDSKRLTPKRRAALCEEIRSVAVAVHVAVRPAPVIDATNILRASLDAMVECVELAGAEAEARGLVVASALVDGNQRLPTCRWEQITVVGGDDKSHTIAAASVVAKVWRDTHMVELGARHPAYLFEKHKGYGSRAHYEAIGEHGPVAGVHRTSFRIRGGWTRQPSSAPPAAAITSGCRSSTGADPAASGGRSEPASRGPSSAGPSPGTETPPGSAAADT